MLVTYGVNKHKCYSDWGDDKVEAKEEAKEEETKAGGHIVRNNRHNRKKNRRQSTSSSKEPIGLHPGISNKEYDEVLAKIYPTPPRTASVSSRRSTMRKTAPTTTASSPSSSNVLSISDDTIGAMTSFLDKPDLESMALTSKSFNQSSERRLSLLQPEYIEYLRNKDKKDLTPEDREVLALDNSRGLWDGSTAAELITDKIDAKERADIVAAIQASLSARSSTSTSDVPELVDDTSSPAPQDEGNTSLSNDDTSLSNDDDDDRSSGGGGGEDEGNETTSSLEGGDSSSAPTGDDGNTSLLSIMGTTLVIDHTASRNHVCLDRCLDVGNEGEIETILLSDDNNSGDDGGDGGGDDGDESSVEEASGGCGMVRRILNCMCGALDKVLCCCCDSLFTSEDEDTPIYAAAMAKRKRDNTERNDELLNVANGVANATGRQDADILMNKPPPEEMANQCPRLVRVYKAYKAHHERVKHFKHKDGTPIFWTCPRLPWDKRSLATTTDPLVVDVLHYNTTQAARSLKDSEHCATKMHSDRVTLLSDTWDFKKEMIGIENLLKCIQVDTENICYLAYTEPTDVIDEKVLQEIRESYKQVLTTIEEVCDAVVLSSKGAMKMYAEWVHDSEEELQTYAAANQDKFILMRNGKVVGGYHPCSFYKKRFRSNMAQKIEVMNALGSAQKQRISGDATAECTYCSGIVDVNSAAYKKAQKRHLAGCSLGGAHAQKLLSEAEARLEAGGEDPDDIERVAAHQDGSSRGGARGGAIGGATTTVYRIEASVFVKWLLDTGLCDDRDEAMTVLLVESEVHYKVYQGTITGGLNAAAGVLKNHDVDGVFKDYFGYTGAKVTALFRDYNVPQLRQFALIYRVELSKEVCDDDGTMPLTNFINATERMIAKISLADLPEDWSLPASIKFIREFSVNHEKISKMTLQVTPSDNASREGTKEMTRNLTLLVMDAMAKFDPQVTRGMYQNANRTVDINCPRFNASCKGRDSSGNTSGNRSSLAYFVLSKVLTQSEDDLKVKLYTCTRCGYPYILADEGWLTQQDRMRVRCPKTDIGGCNKASEGGGARAILQNPS